LKSISEVVSKAVNVCFQDFSWWLGTSTCLTYWDCNVLSNGSESILVLVEIDWSSLPCIFSTATWAWNPNASLGSNGNIEVGWIGAGNQSFVLPLWISMLEVNKVTSCISSSAEVSSQCGVVIWIASYVVSAVSSRFGMAYFTQCWSWKGSFPCINTCSIFGGWWPGCYSTSISAFILEISISVESLWEERCGSLKST
jgi:hypothetical protein